MHIKDMVALISLTEKTELLRESEVLIKRNLLDTRIPMAMEYKEKRIKPNGKIWKRRVDCDIALKIGFAK